MPPPYQSSIHLAFFCWLWARVWWFYLFVCGTNGGSKPPPYTIDRLILWSDGRPPKTLRCLTPAKLSRWRTRVIRCTHMALCCSIGLRTLFSLRIARSVTPPRRCLPPNFRVIVMSCLTDFGLLWSNALTSFRQRFVRPTNFVCRFAFCFPD